MPNPVIKLVAVDVNDEDFEKMDFSFERADKSVLVITLREKADWPIILGQPLENVEKWFLREYGDLMCLLATARLLTPKG